MRLSRANTFWFSAYNNTPCVSFFRKIALKNKRAYQASLFVSSRLHHLARYGHISVSGRPRFWTKEALLNQTSKRIQPPLGFGNNSGQIVNQLSTYVNTNLAFDACIPVASLTKEHGPFCFDRQKATLPESSRTFMGFQRTRRIDGGHHPNFSQATKRSIRCQEVPPSHSLFIFIFAYLLLSARDPIHLF